MAWLNREKAPFSKGQKKEIPEGLWQKCDQCQEIVFGRDFESNQNVCPKCHYHFYIPAPARILFFVDPDSFEECDQHLYSPDPLGFSDKKPYKQRLDDTSQKLGRCDAVICGRARLLGRQIQLGVLDFEFIGGSMGSVVGEKIARLFLRSAETKEPAIVFSSSGGARMQEGLLSLMQMAKTCAALVKVKDQGVPYISVLTDPTTGGVAASFAMLGDINIAEPGALIGFAGPRVIQQTIKENLPPGFQRAEYLLEHGMVDMICNRDSLRVMIAQVLDTLCTKQASQKAPKT